MIVAIEGLDGVGKTTVAGLVRSALNSCEILHTPPRSYYDGNIEVLRNLSCPSRAVLFAAGVLAVNERLQQPRDVRVQVIDRFSGSITGMNRFLYPGMGEVCRELSLISPDLTIELFCDEATRAERLRRRGKPLDPFEIELARDADLRELMRMSIRESAGAHLTLDTSRVNAGQAARLCLYHIQRQLPMPRQDEAMSRDAVSEMVSSLLDVGLSDSDVLRCLGIPAGSPGSDRRLVQNFITHGSDFLAEGRRGMVMDNPRGSEERLAVSISVVGSVAPIAIGGERAKSWVGDNASTSGLLSGVDLVAQARREIDGMVSRRRLDELDATEADQALREFETAVGGGTVDAAKLNWALRILEPLLISAAGSALYAGLAQLVAQLV